MSMIHQRVMRFVEPRKNLVTRSQLQEELHLTSNQITWLVRSQFLHTVRPYLYTTSNPDSIDLPAMELAVCMSSDHAVLSFSSAAMAWGLRRSRRDCFEVTIPKGASLQFPRARIHRATDLDDVDIVQHIDGLRVTSPARTLLDNAAVLDRAGLDSMANDALNKDLCRWDDILDVAHRLCRRGRPGGAAFLAMVREHPDGMVPVGSEDELLLAEAMIAAGLPDPVRQHAVELGTGRKAYLDLALVEVMIDVEVDHSHWHAGLVETQRDKSRDNLLRAKGWEPMRFTDTDVRKRLRFTVDLIRRVHSLRHELFTAAGILTPPAVNGWGRTSVRSRS
jgi:hypothetical protein